MRRAALAVAATALATVAAGAGSSSDAAAASCALRPHPPGWEAVFGSRARYAQAAALRRRAAQAGFLHLVVERVGCPRWAVALHGIRDASQADDFAAEALDAGFAVTTRCVPLRDHDARWEAVFGSRLTERAANALRARAAAVGFRNLELLRDPCSGTWRVQLDDIESLSQAREFKAEAKSAGFAVTLRRH